jgi:DNA-binding GntR family transcriptional regulator
VTTAAAPPALQQLIDRAATSYRSIGDTVLTILREAITSGTFAPGDWLRQGALAEMMGVSRIPVRSSLIQLESEGLVVFQPRKGFQVRRLTVDHLRQTYEIRALLESHALRTSMAGMTATRLSRLTALAEQLDTMPEGAEFVRIRRKFYHLLYDGDRNPMLIELIEQLRTSVGLYLLRRRLSGDAAHAHRHLLGAVTAGDPDAAVGTLLRHLDAVRVGVEQAMDDLTSGQQADAG